MSDLPQRYRDKGFIPQGLSHSAHIELEGQILSIEDYPELYRITFTVSQNYTKSKQVLNQQKDINPQQ